MANTFLTAKNRDKDRAYARAGMPSKCLYVGSSRSVATRLKEHLGFGSSPKTYALQFAHWAQGLDLSLKFCCARYLDSVPAGVMQALEDALWLELAPMFGRRGSR